MIKRLTTWMVFWLLLSQTAWAGAANTSVSIQLRWLHQFQFAGYYAALHKGFYKEVGLDVTIKEGSPSISAIDEVTQGRADFGVSNSGLIKSYLEGKPVLMLAPIIQHTPQVLLHLGTEPKTPRDLTQSGAIGLLPGDESLDLKAIFVNEGIVLDKLNINTNGNGLKDLLSGKIVAMNAYLSNEPFLLQKLGIAYSVIDTRQYGIDFYSDVLFTSRSVEKAKPEAVAAFRSASIKGWEYALANQDEIIGLILAQYNTQAKSRDYLVFEANTLANLIDSDVISLGHSNPGRWRHIVETYAKFGIIKFDYSLDGFLYNPHPPPPDMTWLYRLLAAVLLGLSLIAGILFYIHRLNRKLHRAQLAIVQHMNEQHQFMDMLTHELKTPISVVTLTLDQMTDQNPQKSFKQRAEKAMDDMNNMVERCQQLDHIEHQKPLVQMKSCHLTDILGQLQQRCADPQRLEITAGDLPELQSDPQLISLVLSNLVNNALKYSPAQSPVSMHALANVDAGRAGIQISVQNLPGVAGLPDPAKVFEKYYRSPGAHKQTGSGLGLYLVKSFAALLGGQVKYTIVQQHIRFTLWLPC